MDDTMTAKSDEKNNLKNELGGKKLNSSRGDNQVRGGQRSGESSCLSFFSKGLVSFMLRLVRAAAARSADERS